MQEQSTDYSNLIWKTEHKEKLLHTPVFDVVSQTEVSPDGLRGDYVAVEAPDWIVVVAVHGDNFILVRQWRHGEDRLTVEFPGGVVDPGETPLETAVRELREETGFLAGKMTCLGRVSANPALFKNHFTVFLAEELTATGEQDLDEDELLSYEEIPIEEVIRHYGDDTFTHAYMGTAIAFYLRHRMSHGDGSV